MVLCGGGGGWSMLWNGQNLDRMGVVWRVYGYGCVFYLGIIKSPLEGLIWGEGLRLKYEHMFTFCGRWGQREEVIK